MSFKDRKRSGDIKGYLIIISVLAISIAIGSYFFINESKKVKIDQNTFCPKDEDLNFGKTVALLDLTDPLNKAQKEFFIKEIEQLKKEIPKHHRLTIYTLDQELDLNKSRMITMCNPGSIKDIESTYEKISINPNEIRKMWSEGFSQQISNVVNNIISEEKPQNTSPVMEMFQLIALNEFKNYKGSLNRIIILSDMIQNTNTLSMYESNSLSFLDFKKTDFFSKVRTNLEGNVDIILFIIKRDGSRMMQKNENFYNFWAEYFYEGNKAKDVKLKVVDG